MKRPSARVASLTGAGLAGGIMAGALLAIAMPTSMKQAADDGASPFARSVDVSGAGDYTIPMEVPPQDLSPTGWNGSADLYPATGQPDAWVQPVDSYDTEASYADGSYAEPMTEVALSDAESRLDREVIRDDGAAASAEAARDAAAEVRAVENAAVAPDAGNDDGSQTTPSSTT